MPGKESLPVRRGDIERANLVPYVILEDRIHNYLQKVVEMIT